MLTGYLERSSSHGPMLAYLMLHLQVGIRTQTRTEIATLSNCQGRGQYCLTSRKGLVSGRPGWWPNLGHRLSRPPDQL